MFFASIALLDVLHEGGPVVFEVPSNGIVVWCRCTVCGVRSSLICLFLCQIFWFLGHALLSCAGGATPMVGGSSPQEAAGGSDHPSTCVHGGAARQVTSRQLSDRWALPDV